MTEPWHPMTLRNDPARIPAAAGTWARHCGHTCRPGSPVPSELKRRFPWQDRGCKLRYRPSALVCHWHGTEFSLKLSGRSLLVLGWDRMSERKSDYAIDREYSSLAI